MIIFLTIAVLVLAALYACNFLALRVMGRTLLAIGKQNEAFARAIEALVKNEQKRLSQEIEKVREKEACVSKSIAGLSGRTRPQ